MKAYFGLTILIVVFGNFIASASADCSGAPHGTVFPDYDDKECRKYQICCYDEWQKLECNKGQIFSKKLGYCIDKDDGSCQATETTSSKPTTTESTSSEPTTKSTSTTSTTTTKPTSTPPSGPGCSGVPPGTIFPDYDDKECRKYQVCVIDKWTYLACDVGQIFSKYEFKCIGTDDKSCIYK